jgi:hypothetical protein
MPRYRKKPLAQLEHGTRIFAPSARETRYRVVTTDPTSGERIFVKCAAEDQARAKAREPGQFVADMRPPCGPGPTTTSAGGRRSAIGLISDLGWMLRCTPDAILEQ